MFGMFEGRVVEVANRVKRFKEEGSGREKGSTEADNRLTCNVENSLFEGKKVLGKEVEGGLVEIFMRGGVEGYLMARGMEEKKVVVGNGGGDTEKGGGRRKEGEEGGDVGRIWDIFV